MPDARCFESFSLKQIRWLIEFTRSFQFSPYGRSTADTALDGWPLFRRFAGFTPDGKPALRINLKSLHPTYVLVGPFTLIEHVLRRVAC